MRRIMILGAGAAQLPLIRTAKAMGYEAVVATIPGPYPGVQEADAVSYTDITDREGVARAARELGVCAVTSCCSELALPAQARACQALGLPGPSPEAAEISVDKLVMKRVFAEKGVRSAAFRTLRSESDALAAAEALGFPLVIKAADLFSSRGVYVVRSADEARQALRQCLALTRKDYCLAEAFIDGRGFCAEAFVQNGRILFVLPDGNLTLQNPGRPAIPIGHYAPLDCGEGEYERICAEVEGAIRACGIDNCAVNLDLVMREGEPYIIELTARAGATGLSELISLHFGVDYYRMILMAALGQDAGPLFETRRRPPLACAVRMLTSDSAGVVRAVRLPQPLPDGIHELRLDVGAGDSVRRFDNAGDRIGRLIASAGDVHTCLARIDKTLAQIEIEVEPC